MRLVRLNKKTKAQSWNFKNSNANLYPIKKYAIILIIDIQGNLKYKPKPT